MELFTLTIESTTKNFNHGSVTSIPSHSFLAYGFFSVMLISSVDTSRGVDDV